MGSRTTDDVQSMSNFPWGIGAAYDADDKLYQFEATIRCSDGDIKTEIQPPEEQMI